MSTCYEKQHATIMNIEGPKVFRAAFTLQVWRQLKCAWVTGEHGKVNGQTDNTQTKCKYFCIKIPSIFSHPHPSSRKANRCSIAQQKFSVEKPGKPKKQGLNSNTCASPTEPRVIGHPNRSILGNVASKLSKWRWRACQKGTADLFLALHLYLGTVPMSSAWLLGNSSRQRRPTLGLAKFIRAMFHSLKGNMTACFSWWGQWLIKS